MSKKAIILYDENASDIQMAELLRLLDKIVPKLDNAIGIDVCVDYITDMLTNGKKECDHFFCINDDCNKVICNECDKLFPVAVNSDDRKKIEEERKRDKKSVVDGVRNKQ